MDALLDDLNSPKLLATINSWLKNANPEIIWIIVWLDQNVMKMDLLWENENQLTEIMNNPKVFFARTNPSAYKKYLSMCENK